MVRAPQPSGLGLGIDIGGSKAHGLVLDADERVLAQFTAPTEPGADGVRRTVLRVAGELAGALGIRAGGFASVGLGIPGVVDHTTGIVETAVNLAIDHCDLAALLAGDFAVGVRVENDVKAAALGAGQALGPSQWSCGGRATGDLAYVNLGTGLAVAAVSGGRLVRGVRNGAGEIGHLSLDPAGEPCGCGQRGCLETLVGGGHLDRRLAALGLRLAALPDAAGAGAGERDRLVGAVATTLALVAIAYDPGVLVVGGGVVSAAAWLLPAVDAELRRRAAGSPFLAGLAIADRVVEVPAATPVAAIGAALVGRGRPRAAAQLAG